MEEVLIPAPAAVMAVVVVLGRTDALQRVVPSFHRRLHIDNRRSSLLASKLPADKSIVLQLGLA